MATSTSDWKDSAKGINQKRPEPIITFDHISNSENFSYFIKRNKFTGISSVQLLIDSVLLAGMVVALIILC